jgi:hypothetical protein
MFSQQQTVFQKDEMVRKYLDAATASFDTYGWLLYYLTTLYQMERLFSVG